MTTEGRRTNQSCQALHLNSNEVHLGIYESLTSAEATIFLSYSRRWVLYSLCFPLNVRFSEIQFLFFRIASSRLFSSHPRLLSTMHRDFHFVLILVFSWWLAPLQWLVSSIENLFWHSQLEVSDSNLLKVRSLNISINRWIMFVLANSLLSLSQFLLNYWQHDLLVPFLLTCFLNDLFYLLLKIYFEIQNSSCLEFIIKECDIRYFNWSFVRFYLVSLFSRFIWRSFLKSYS